VLNTGNYKIWKFIQINLGLNILSENNACIHYSISRFYHNDALTQNIIH